MKNIQKFFKKFIRILILSGIAIVVLNLFIYAFYMQGAINESNNPYSPSKMLTKTSSDLSYENGRFILSSDMEKTLKNKNIFAMLIDNHSGKVIWSFNMPQEIPMSYSASDISKFSKSYLKDYPVFTWEHNNGLLVLGYPKNSYTKLISNYIPISTLKSVSWSIVVFFACNITLVSLIYMFISSKMIKSINPIISGIDELSRGNTVCLVEKGELSEICKSVNTASKILQQKSTALKKKDEARTNWISGVSHDIRTPLSMVLGYASELEEDDRLPIDVQKQMTIIKNQGMKMKQLINDLNLASKLEYDMQLMNCKKIMLLELIRQVVSDFINNGLSSLYSVEIESNADAEGCIINGDEQLLKRAVTNLIQNSINHNADGCEIKVSVFKKDNNCIITVSDNGIGISNEQLMKLKSTPHYMSCNSFSGEPRHGLGLFIVDKIIKTHGGTVNFTSEEGKGFQTTIVLPI